MGFKIKTGVGKNTKEKRKRVKKQREIYMTRKFDCVHTDASDVTVTMHDVTLLWSRNVSGHCMVHGHATTGFAIYGML